VLDEHDAHTALTHHTLKYGTESFGFAPVETRGWLVKEQQVERPGQASGQFDQATLAG
jgi:hypothetical protein